MSAFTATCQGIGLALALGLLAAAPGPRGTLRPLLAVLAAALGAAALGLSLGENGHTALPGVVAGALVAALAFSIGRQVAIGAGERARSGTAGAEGSSLAIAGSLALVAAAFAALATLVPPASLALLAAFAWLAVSRRRRGQRKHAGLRVLR